MILLLDPAEHGGSDHLLPDKYHFILINPLPEPWELTAFCVCAVDASGGGCMRRPRAGRAPRRSRGTRSAGLRDDGSGDDDGGPNFPCNICGRAPCLTPTLCTACRLADALMSATCWGHA